MEAAQKIKRYPSIRSFEKNEANLFFGRDLEIQQLFNKVMAEKEVLLFARSGIGKSSLINAGLIPMLEKRGLLPLPVRLNKEAAADALRPDALVKKELERYFDASEMPAAYPHGMQLWEYIKCCSFPLGATPVLILDQFEQFFYFTAGEQQQFMLQLAELVQQYEPARVANWYSDLNEETAKRENAWFTEQPPFKVVIAIRSDRLYELNRLAEYMPTILRNRYELQPLRQESAETAITAPAAREDESLYQSRHFVYNAGLKNAIITSLQGGNGNIETTQLQIVCSEIENRILLTPDDEPAKPAGYEVSLADIQAIGGIEKIIDEFYGNQVAKMGDAAQVAAARAFIENELYDAANNGRRIVFEEEAKKVITSYAEDKTANGITPERMLSQLLDLRLIREDLRETRKFYEISHDYLLGAIGKSYEKRKGQEEKQKLLSDLKKQRQEKKVVNVLLALTVLALAGAIWFIVKARREKAKSQDVAAKLYIALARQRMENYDHYQAYNLLYASNQIGNKDVSEFVTNSLPAQLLAGIEVAWHPGDIISSLTADSVLYIWRLKNDSLQLLEYFPNPGNYLFSSDGRRLFIPDSVKNLTVWELGSGSPVLCGRIRHPDQNIPPVPAPILVNSNGHVVLFPTLANSAVRWNFYNGEYKSVTIKCAGLQQLEQTIYNSYKNVTNPGAVPVTRLLSRSDSFLIYIIPNLERRWRKDGSNFEYFASTFKIYTVNLADEHSKPVLVESRSPTRPLYDPATDKLLFRKHNGTMAMLDISSGAYFVQLSLKREIEKNTGKPYNYVHRIFKNLIISQSNSDADTSSSIIITDWIKDSAYSLNKKLGDNGYWYDEFSNKIVRSDALETRWFNLPGFEAAFATPPKSRNLRITGDGSLYVYTIDDTIFVNSTKTRNNLWRNCIKFKNGKNTGVMTVRNIKIYNGGIAIATLADHAIMFLLTPPKIAMLRAFYPEMRDSMFGQYGLKRKWFR